jgi:hypothetical protein
MRALPCLIVLAVMLLGVAPVPAGELRRIPDAHVEAALAAAGANRAELERVLAHFDAQGEARRRVAARFLIANMPGHGYITTVLRDLQGKPVAYDPLAYADFEAAQGALDELEKAHGTLEFDRDAIRYDVEHIRADFLIGHIDAAFSAWESSPADRRVGFSAFLDFVLPHRGSQEPVHDWLTPLMARYAKMEAELPPVAGEDAGARARRLYRLVGKDVHKRVRFNERFYLHPTDQGFEEMEQSGQGRCEDITNMLTFAYRSLGLATAADYTPAWAHRDNNHAWNVLLDADGRGHDKGNAHAAKVYRKTYALQRDNLAFLLPEGRKAPNRFLASKTYIDVTDQYAPTTDVTVPVEGLEGPATEEGFAYACVFNGGEWVAIDWSRIVDGHAEFKRLGRNICYLPAVHDGTRLVPIGPPFLVHRAGTVQWLGGTGGATELRATATSPRKVSPDTHAVTPTSYFEPGARYTLYRWGPGGWTALLTHTADDKPLAHRGLPQDGLYWLVKEGSRTLERIFTIQEGVQRWW